MAFTAKIDGLELSFSAQERTETFSISNEHGIFSVFATSGGGCRQPHGDQKHQDGRHLQWWIPCVGDPFPDGSRRSLDRTTHHRFSAGSGHMVQELHQKSSTRKRQSTSPRARLPITDISNGWVDDDPKRHDPGRPVRASQTTSEELQRGRLRQRQTSQGRYGRDPGAARQTPSSTTGAGELQAVRAYRSNLDEGSGEKDDPQDL